MDVVAIVYESSLSPVSKEIIKLRYESKLTTRDEQKQFLDCNSQRTFYRRQSDAFNFIKENWHEKLRNTGLNEFIG